MTANSSRIRQRPRKRRRQQQQQQQQEHLFFCYVHSVILAVVVVEGGHSNENTTSTDTEQSYSSSSSKDKGHLTYRSVCHRTLVQVTSLNLLCDSPGAYYYGSSTYRNSEVCMSNDKAIVKMTFTVSDGYRGESILMTVESGLYNQFVTVLEAINICQVAVSSSNENNNDCPIAGSDYAIQTYFSVPQQTGDYRFHYTPDLRITFIDHDDGMRLGCITSGTLALHQSADHKASSGMMALGISVLVFVSVFGMLIYASYARKKRIERDREMASRRYNYFRTLPNGQVVPIGTPGGGEAGAQGGGQQQFRHHHHHHSHPQLTSVASMATQSSTDDESISGYNALSSSSYRQHPSKPPTRPVI